MFLLFFGNDFYSGQRIYPATPVALKKEHSYIPLTTPVIGATGVIIIMPFPLVL